MVDVNANRAREGLRVAEDVARLVVCDEKIAATLKNLRHGLTELCSSLASEDLLIAERDSESDLGREPSFDSGEKSEGMRALVRRNMRRSEEACRVLEEACDLVDGSFKARFKDLRFAMYDAEKVLLERL